MNEMQSITLNGTKYDSFPDKTARGKLDALALYDLDLTEAVSLAVDTTEALSFDVSEASDWAAVQAAVEAGRMVRVHFMENGGLREASVLLTGVHYFENSGTYTLSGIYEPTNGKGLFKCLLGFAYEEEYDAYNAFLVFNPGTVDSDGDSQVASISVVKTDGEVTVTTTMADGSTHTDVITLDDDDTPTNINSDGVDIPVTFEGFEEESEWLYPDDYGVSLDSAVNDFEENGYAELSVEVTAEQAAEINGLLNSKNLLGVRGSLEEDGSEIEFVSHLAYRMFASNFTVCVFAGVPFNYTISCVDNIFSVAVSQEAG